MYRLNAKQGVGHNWEDRNDDGHRDASGEIGANESNHQGHDGDNWGHLKGYEVWPQGSLDPFGLCHGDTDRDTNNCR